jgi:hypothetical protein
MDKGTRATPTAKVRGASPSKVRITMGSHAQRQQEATRRRERSRPRRFRDRFDETSAVDPPEPTSHREAGELPETYPWGV